MSTPVHPVARPEAASAQGRAAKARPPGPAAQVAAKELLELRLDARLRLALVLLMVLMAVALLLGVLQHLHNERERADAERIDRGLWTSQGEKDPHSAAHFGQYAFKPQSLLALADPGIDAYVGSAVWLEAHKQNEVQFNPARDRGAAARLGSLSLAFVLQAVLPLLVIMLGFAAFSGERERGTLRQLMSQGVAPRSLLAGKALALARVLAVVLLPVALSLVVLSGVLEHDGVPGVLNQAGRSLGFVAGYALYLGGFIGLTLGVSAIARSSRAALVALLGFWLANCFILPRVMTEIARDVVPLPSALAFRSAIAADRARQFGHDETHPAYIALRDETLKRYGVKRIEDLPVNFRGIALQRDDENGYRIYDQRFGELQQAFTRQDRLRESIGWLAPMLAIQPFSMSLAGTDLRHQADFAARAEQHRRLIQTATSDDLIANSKYGDTSYVAGPSLWARIPPFDYATPAAGWALYGAAYSGAALLLWFGLCSGIALISVRRLRAL